MVTIHPSAGNTLTLRVSLQRVPGTLGKLTSALGAAGALLDAIDIIEHQGDVIVRQIQVETRGEAHGREVVEAARAVSGVELLSVSDRMSTVPPKPMVWCTSGRASSQGLPNVSQFSGYSRCQPSWMTWRNIP